MSDDTEIHAEMPLPEKPNRRPSLRTERDAVRLSPGSFFAEHRAAIDARKTHLARLGMDPVHVAALRMPTTAEETLPARGTPVTPMPVAVAEETETLLAKRRPKEAHE